MRATRLWMVVAVCVLGASVSAWGQAAPQGGAPGAVVQYVPQDAMGVVIIKNLKATLNSTQDYMKAIGVDQMLPPEISQNLLGMLTQSLQLGQGFDANGGLAIAMLNPQKFGIDLPKMLSDEDPAPPEKLPFVVFVPGQDIQSVFGAYQPTEAGKSQKIMLPVGEMFAREMKGYVLLSPMEEALEAVQTGQAQLPKALNALQSQIIDDSALAMYLDVNQLAPLMEAVVQKLQQQADQAKEQGYGGDEQQMAARVMAVYAEMFKQVENAVLAVRMTDQALRVEKAAVMKADTNLAKLMQALKSGTGPLLHRLPNLPYVLAVGSHTGGQQAQQIQRDMARAMVQSMIQDEQVLARINELLSMEDGNVKTMQFVVGGAPQGSGVFGAAAVWEVENPDQLKSALVSSAASIKEIILALIPEDEREEFEQLEIKFEQNVEKVGDTTVDAIVLTHPEMAEMDEDDKQEMAKALGEDKLRVLLASPAKNLLVATFGGSVPFLTQAIQTATEAKGLAQDPGVQKALAMLPENPQSVFLFSPSNLLKVVQTAAQAMGEEAPPIQLTSTLPVAAATKVQDSTLHGVMILPNELVKELVQMAGMFMMGGGGGGGGMQEEPYEGNGGEDF